jgi:hypothetical protein
MTVRETINKYVDGHTNNTKDEKKKHKNINKAFNNTIWLRS